MSVVSLSQHFITTNKKLPAYKHGSMGIVIFGCALTVATATHIIATVIPECIFWYDKHLGHEINQLKREKINVTQYWMLMCITLKAKLLANYMMYNICPHLTSYETINHH